MSFSSKLHRFKLIFIHLLICLFIFDSLIVEQVSGTTKIPSKWKSNGGFPRYRIQKTTSRGKTITSVEKPPVSTSNLDNYSLFDHSGVTLPPPSSALQEITSKRRSNSIFNLTDKLSGLRSAFTRLSNVMFQGNSGDGVSTGRGGGFMDGAMVPMTFLLMAAFIMDILQRLFPLPYASFVHDYAHSHPIPHHLPHPVPPIPEASRDKFELTSPVGNIIASTNAHKHGFLHGLLGRANQGNPQVLPENYNPGPPPNETPTEGGGEVADPIAGQIADLLYLTNLNNQAQPQQEQPQEEQQPQEENFQFPSEPQFQDAISQFLPQPQQLQQDEYSQQQQQEQQGDQQLQDPATVQSQREQEAEKSVSGGNTDDNSLARFDYVDYYSRFDENGQLQQPWKKKKRSVKSNKLITKKVQ